MSEHLLLLRRTPTAERREGAFAALLWKSMLPLWRTVPVVLGRPPRSRERSALRGAGGFVVPGRNGENDLYLGSPAGRERRLGRLAARVRAQAPAVVVVADPGLWRLTGDLDFGPVKRVLVLEAFQADDADTLAAAKAADEVWVREGADAAALAKALGTKAAKRLLRMPAAVEGGAPVAYEAGAMVMAPLDGGADDEAGVALARAVAERLAAEGVPVTLSFIPADADPGAVEHLAEEAAIILAPFDAPHYRPSLLFALAMGRPLVASPGAMDGLALKAGEQALVGKDAGELAEHIVALLADPERAAAMGAAAAAGVRAKHDIDTTRALLRAAKGDAAGDPQEMAGANVAPTIRQLEVFFNPTSRLFTATAFLRCAAPNSAITGCFQVEGVENLANAWVQTTAQPDGWNFISADAVLPADVSIPQLSVVIEAFGLPVMTLRFPEDVDRERAGFISLELDDFSLKVDAWSSDPELKLQAGTRMLSPEVIPAIGPEGAAAGEARTWKGEGDAPDITAQAVRLQGVSAWPLTRKAVKAITSEGRGQNFGRLDEWFGAERPTSLRLQRMKDIHKGQVAWLIGNGPSVRVKDLDRLSGQVTFGFNRFHLSHEATTLRPTYTVTADRQMIEDFGQEIVDVSGGQVFVAHDEAPPLVGDYIWLRQMAIFPPLISREPARAVTPGGSSLFVAMQLAAFMGIRKLYLYGADFHFNFERNLRARDTYRAVSGDGNHFIKNYRSGKAWCPPSFRNIATGFLAARIMMESEGGFIRNATRGGAMEIFPREDFESALATSSAPESQPLSESQPLQEAS